MDQFLVINRGAPASGKTTLAKRFRDFDKKIAWLKVDNFKEFFSEEGTLDQQRFVDESALLELKYLLDKGFSVVMEKIFFDPFIIPLALDAAKERGINGVVFQIRCPLEELKRRDLSRPGVKEGLRKALGDVVIERLFNQLEDTYYPGAVEIDTSKKSVEECVELIRSTLK